MLILERFMGDFALIEGPNGNFTVPVSHIKDAKEGDVLILENGMFRPDKEATDKRAQMLKKRFEKMSKRDE